MGAGTPSDILLTSACRLAGESNLWNLVVRLTGCCILSGCTACGMDIAVLRRERYHGQQRLHMAVQATFPNERHRLLNKALPGTTSAYISPCALQMVPPDADFVLLEFTFNDAERASTGQSAEDPTRCSHYHRAGVVQRPGLTQVSGIIQLHFPAMMMQCWLC